LDLISFGIGGIIKDIAQIVFFPAVFFILKAPFWKGKKASKKIIAMVIGALTGFIPYVSTIMPEVAISVFMTVYLTRKEDKEALDDPDVAKRRDKNITRYKRVREKVR
jgi:predicted branched-subunit amino acid permease